MSAVTLCLGHESGRRALRARRGRSGRARRTRGAWTRSQASVAARTSGASSAQRVCRGGVVGAAGSWGGMHACSRCSTVSILRTASACLPIEMIRSSQAAAIAGGSRTDAPSRKSISCCCSGCTVLEVAFANAAAIVCPLDVGAEGALPDRLNRFFIPSREPRPRSWALGCPRAARRSNFTLKGDITPTIARDATMQTNFTFTYLHVYLGARGRRN